MSVTLMSVARNEASSGGQLTAREPEPNNTESVGGGVRVGRSGGEGHLNDSVWS